MAGRWLVFAAFGAVSIACHHPTPRGQVVVEVRDGVGRFGVTGCTTGKHLAPLADVTVSVGTTSQAAAGNLQLVEAGLPDSEGWLQLSRRASDLLRDTDSTGSDRVDLVIHFELVTDSGRTYGSQLGVPLKTVQSFLQADDEGMFLVGFRVAAERPEGVCVP